jgi:hypothetical protein
MSSCERDPTNGEESAMPTWIKPAAWGAVSGSIVTMLIGFNYGGWTTASTTDRLIRQQADAAVTAALVPVCVAQSKSDQMRAKKLGELRAITSSYEQQEFIAKTGWANIPGSEDVNRDVAEACAAALLKTASR